MSERGWLAVFILWRAAVLALLIYVAVTTAQQWRHGVSMIGMGLLVADSIHVVGYARMTRRRRV
jgi:hypothetical protein